MVQMWKVKNAVSKMTTKFLVSKTYSVIHRDKGRMKKNTRNQREYRELTFIQLVFEMLLKFPRMDIREGSWVSASVISV